jgi:hypothetical protein
VWSQKFLNVESAYISDSESLMCLPSVGFIFQPNFDNLIDGSTNLRHGSLPNLVSDESTFNEQVLDPLILPVLRQIIHRPAINL